MPSHSQLQSREKIATAASTTTHLSLTANPSPSCIFLSFPRTSCSRQLKTNRFKCSASQTGFFTLLGRLIKEKAKSDVEKIFSGFSKTRDNLAVIDELLLYWNLADTDRVLDELEEALLVSDFGPRITVKIVESLREDILGGKLKSGSEIKDALNNIVLDLLVAKGSKTELQLGFRKPAVLMIVGVNGGGKTTSCDVSLTIIAGKLAYRLRNKGAKILMAAGDTFRAAASDQLEIWAERTECEIVVADEKKAKASAVYEGMKSFYKEEDETVPVNIYGKSKVAAEQFIFEKCSSFAILRSSIIFGPQTISPVPKSLPIQWIDGVLNKGEQAEFFYDEFRCPIYVKDVVAIILNLTSRWITEGKQMQLLLNVGGPDRVSRVQMAEAVARIRGYDTSLIKPIAASSVDRGVSSPPDIWIFQNWFRH